ncbi:MAG: hypothetical protein ACLU9T_17760 [Blautia faecis]
MYEHPFTIKEVAWLLSIRCLEGGSDQEFPVECPYCGDTRGKCSFCISKNGEIKNVFHCFHCGQGGNMLTLYADIMGLYGEDRCKTAYQEIINRLENGGQVTGSTYKKITCRYKAKTDEVKRSPEYVDLVYRQMLSLLQLHTLHKQDLKKTWCDRSGNKGTGTKGYKSIEPKKAGTIAKKLLEKDLGWTESQVFFGIGTACGKLRFMRETEATCALCIPLNHKIKGLSDPG